MAEQVGLLGLSVQLLCECALGLTLKGRKEDKNTDLDMDKVTAIVVKYDAKLKEVFSIFRTPLAPVTAWLVLLRYLKKKEQIPF